MAAITLPVEAARLSLPNALELVVLQDTQELRLDGGIELTNLVEKDSSVAAAGFEPAGAGEPFLLIAGPFRPGYVGHMEKATISELKNQLSAYLAKVKAGASVLILDRDKPIACLERVDPARYGDERLVRLERAGIIRRGSGNVPGKPRRRVLPKPKHSLVQALLDEREEGR